MLKTIKHHFHLRCRRLAESSIRVNEAPPRPSVSLGLLHRAARHRRRESSVGAHSPHLSWGGDSIVRHESSAPLLLYGLAAILLTISKGWDYYLAYQRIAGMEQRIAYDRRNRIFSHLQSLPPSFFDRANTGNVMSRATSDVEAVRMFINRRLSSFLEMMLLFIAARVLMSLMSWRLTLPAAAMFPPWGTP
jgi:ABC-type multidrug transport system fused ATPase/permease subunit